MCSKPAEPKYVLHFSVVEMKTDDIKTFRCSHHQY